MFKDVSYRITHWETWDWRLKYIPLMPWWFWYCFRSGSMWFFTTSNPTLTFGGFDGETKSEMYSHLPPHTYPKSICISHLHPFDEVKKLFAANSLQLPCAVKPDSGRMGLMFRKIDTLDDLKRYHEKMPVNYVLQEYINHPLEISVFYYRYPHEKSGHITGFIKKEFLEITGDGKSTLEELINNYSRVRFRQQEMKLKHQEKLNMILSDGERFCLSNALNLSRGGKLVSLEHEKDESLLKVFDDLSHYAKHFYYGRYDIKCTSIEDLKQGKNFSILEYNGSGAEPHHVYGNGNTFIQACSILLGHWKVLYKISKMNRDLGNRYWKFKEGWEFFKQANRHIKMLKQIDSEFPAS